MHRLDPFKLESFNHMSQERHFFAGGLYQGHLPLQAYNLKWQTREARSRSNIQQEKMELVVRQQQ
jgi:hypothetical protein